MKKKLFTLIKVNNLKKVQNIMEEYSFENKIKNAALHIAVMHSKSKIIKFLLHEGVDINSKDQNEQTVLHKALYRVKEATAILDYEDIKQRYILNDYNIRYLYIIVNCIQKYKRAYKNYNESIIILKMLLSHDNINVNNKDKDGVTAFCYAFRFSSIDNTILKLLFDEGVDIHVPDNNNKSAVDHMFSMLKKLDCNKDIPIIRCLVDNYKCLYNENYKVNELSEIKIDSNTVKSLNKIMKILFHNPNIQNNEYLLVQKLELLYEELSTTEKQLFICYVMNKKYILSISDINLSVPQRLLKLLENQNEFHNHSIQLKQFLSDVSNILSLKIQSYLTLERFISNNIKKEHQELFLKKPFSIEDIIQLDPRKLYLLIYPLEQENDKIITQDKHLNEQEPPLDNVILMGG